MIHSAPLAADASKRLRRVEDLLDQALADLAGKNSSAPCSPRCTALFTEALAELQSFADLLITSKSQESTFLPRVKTLVAQLKTAELLLADAAEFYRGWCAAGCSSAGLSAAGSPLGYSVSGYQIAGISHGPALLAFEA